MVLEIGCVTSLYRVEVGSWRIRTGICVAELRVNPSPSYFAYCLYWSVMFDKYIYSFIDWSITRLEKFREWLIVRSLPKGESVKEWAKKNAKIDKNSYK